MNTVSLERVAELCVAQLWQVTVLAAGLALATKILCRHRPHLAYLLWMVVLIKCVTPPVVASRLSPFSWTLAERADRVVDTRLTTQPSKIDAMVPQLDQPAVAAAAPPGSTTVASALVKPSSRPWRMIGALGIWGLGACGLGILVTAQWLALQRVVRAGQAPSAELKSLLATMAGRLKIKRAVRIVVTPESQGPMVSGVIRPTIVLPAASLAGADLEPVLAHELVHVRRGDTAISLLQTVAQVVWWYHPLVWWMNREMRRERERSCDEEVVAGLNYAPTRYARSLLAVLELVPGRRSAWATSGVPMLSFTGQRLRHLTRTSARFHRRTPLMYWVVGFALLAMVLPGAGLSLEAPPVGGPPTNTVTKTNIAAPDMTSTIQFDGLPVVDEEETSNSTTGEANAGAASDAPLVARELGSAGQRAAVVAIEKFGGNVHASRDKSGAIHLNVVIDTNWKGGTDGLKQLQQLDGLRMLYVACNALAADGLQPLRQLKSVDQLQLGGPSDAQLAALADWDLPTHLFLMDGTMTDAGLAYAVTMPNLSYLMVHGDRARTMDPRRPSVTDAGIAQLKQLKKLARLTIVDCEQVTGATLGELATSKHLNELTFLQNDLNASGVVELAKLAQLKVLMVNTSNLKSGDYAPLAKMTGLQTLSLNEARGFDDVAAAYLAPLINLRTVHLFETAISDAGLSSLTAMKQLRQLIVWKGMLTDAGLAHLSGLTELRILRLDSETSDFGDAGLRSLSGLTKLQILALEAKRVSDAGLEALERLTNLRVLDLQHAQIRGPGLPRLQSLVKLRELNLAFAPIDDAGLRSLPALTKLSSLSLSDTKLTDAGLASLAQFPNLTDLILQNTQTTDAGLPTLVKLPALIDLDLANTKITDAGLDELAKAKQLRKVSLIGTQVTKEGAERFQKKYPKIAVKPEFSWTISGAYFTLSVHDDEIEEEAGADQPAKSAEKQ